VTKSRNGSIHALSGAYVVDALDDAERAAFEEHLPGCHDCQAEVSSLREAAAMLADDAALTPPASLRANVLAGIRTVRPLPPKVEEATEPGDESEGSVAKVVPLRRHRFRMANLAAAAVILAVLGIAAVSQPWRDQPGPGVSQAGVADRVMAAVDAKHVKVSFPDGATATVIRSAKMGKAVVVTEKMPAAPDGKVYELWLRNSTGRMVPAGLMKGSGDQKQLLQGDAANANAAAISLEPSGGSKEPTNEPIALFDFDQAGA
jgi:anti-sigma-K factor RskA